MDKSYNFGISDFLMAVLQNVIVANDLEGVGAFDTLTCFSEVLTDVLAEATEFVGV